MAADSYRAQSAEAALALAERVASHPDVVDALEVCGASPVALVVAAGLAVGRALRESTRRTERLPSTRRDIVGAVPVHRTMGHGCRERCGKCEDCIACTYEILAGAPVGTPESLETARAEARATAADAAWALRNARAEAGTLLTRKQRRNQARAARRASR
jgi:hypothetical protein